MANHPEIPESCETPTGGRLDKGLESARKPKSEAEARAILQNIGIITEDGELAPQYAAKTAASATPKHRLTAIMRSIEEMADFVSDDKIEEFNELLGNAAKRLDEGKYEECRLSMFHAHELVVWGYGTG